MFSSEREIGELLGLEGSWGAFSSKLLLALWPALRSDQVAPGFVWLGLESLQLGTCSSVWLSSSWTFFPYVKSEPPFPVYTSPLILLACTSVNTAWLCPVSNLLVAIGKLLSGPPLSLLFSRLNKPSYLNPPHRASAPAPVFFCTTAVLAHL